MTIEKIQAPAKNLSITVKGYEGSCYSSCIELTFEQDTYYDTKIDIKKVRKALDIVTDCNAGFELLIRGYGQELENHSSRWTSLYSARVDTEDYKGMTLYAVRINNNYGSSKAYPTANDAIKMIMQEVKKSLESATLDFDYLEQEQTANTTDQINMLTRNTARVTIE
jgi:hypothetical protein